MLKSNYIQVYGELFEAVQLNNIFPDQKFFVDTVPKIHPQDILDKYLENRTDKNFDLKQFVEQYFDHNIKSIDETPSSHSNLLEYINNFWSVINKDFQTHNKTDYSTLINLPYKHLVPGGRFTEFYYWDSYFTALGLDQDNFNILVDMLENFGHMIDKFGFIPNGNRQYYLSRSQPPYFSLLIELLLQRIEDWQIDYKVDYLKYFVWLEKEYSFWMRGSRAVKHDQDCVLNRYYDSLNTPRPEGYSHDISLAKQYLGGQSIGSEIEKSQIYRKIRAVCESGWDFSSRWLDNSNNINILELCPIDLNCLVYNQELVLAKLSKFVNNGKEQFYNKVACNRRMLIQQLMWDSSTGFYYDYNYKLGKPNLAAMTLAGVSPLFYKIADKQQARCVADNLENKFLCPGGLVATLVDADNQWDSPNGWAPLQWIAVKGLLNYGYNDLAYTIADRWVDTVTKNFGVYKTVFEKYNVKDCSVDVSRGEYQLQQGFGWTNGVTKLLIEILVSRV